jgi:hypothetical protein
MDCKCNKCIDVDKMCVFKFHTTLRHKEIWKNNNISVKQLFLKVADIITAILWIKTIKNTEIWECHISEDVDGLQGCDVMQSCRQYASALENTATRELSSSVAWLWFIKGDDQWIYKHFSQRPALG